MKSKRNYKKIIALVLMLMFTLTVFNPVNAALTEVDGGEICEDLYKEDAEGNKTPVLDGEGNPIKNCVSQPTGKVSTTVGQFGDGVAKVVSYIIELIASTAAMKFLSYPSYFISLLSVVLILVLNTLFSLGTGNFASAMPDSIIFNTVPFLDVNFINPHNNSFYTYLTVGNSGANTAGNLAANLFQSFRALAMTVMIIALMITGLKLALSTVAAKKAQYKEAVLKWLTGFVILLALKWILAGIFYMNELIVANLAATAADSRFDIAIQFVDLLPGALRIIGDAWKAIAGKFFGGTGSFIHVEGFWGIILLNLIRSFTPDLVASIVGFVVIGQSFVVVGSYLRRLFMTFILGVVSPLVVAVDTINGIMGAKSTIFKSWLKTFLFTVFIQSIHAAYLVVMLYILKSIYQTAFLNYYLQSLLTIWWMTGLVKLEKIIKNMFGFGDSLAGSLADGSKGFKKALQAGMGLAAAAKSIGDNAQKAKAANAQKATAKSRVQDLEAKANKRAELKGKMESAYEAAKKGKEEGHMSIYLAEREKYAAASKELKALEGGVSDGTDPVKAAINGSSSKSTTLDDELAAARADYDAASREARGANLANIMGPANLAAGIGIGIGSGDDMSEALFKGGMITSALDKTSEFVGRASYDVTSGKATGAVKGAIQGEKEFLRSVHDAESGLDKLGVVAKKFAREATRSGEIISSAMNTMSSSASKASSAKPSSSSSQPQQTVNVTVDVAKISNELTKQLSKSMSGIGEEIGKAIKKELKDIDKKVDNE